MNLTETAQVTRRGFKLFLVLGTALIMIWIIVQFVYRNVYKPFVQSQVKADQRFGLLPPPIFPKSLIASSNLNYTLDTTSGNLPGGFPKVINVYFIPQQVSRLESPDQARKTAAGFKFKDPPDIASPTTYKFHDEFGGEMTIDLTTENFSINRPAPTDIDAISRFNSENSVTEQFKNYLGTHELVKEELKKGEAKTKFDQGNAQSSETATITMWQNSIDKFPIVTPKLNEGLINATVYRGGDIDRRYTKLTYVYWPIDRKIFGTYFVKPVEQAFEQLKNGGGIVVLNSEGKNASISKVYLAYFISSSYSPYAQPVYVFQGNNFAVYVSAIDDASVKK